MAYVTLTEWKQANQEQLLQTTEHDGAIRAALAAAEAIVNLELGYSFAAAAPGTAVLYGDGTDYLKLPATYVEGSVTAVTAPSGYTVPDYVEQEGYLVVSRDGVLGAYPYRGLSYPYGYGYGWQRGIAYTVAGNFGNSAPDDIKLAVREIATQLWRFRDAGGAEVVGNDAGVRTVRSSLSPLVRSILEAHRTSTVGVW